MARPNSAMKPSKPLLNAYVSLPMENGSIAYSARELVHDFEKCVKVLRYSVSPKTAFCNMVVVEVSMV